MYKLLIVDDEEVICSSLASLTPWADFNIELMGTCLDGVDAYHTILDELPDIVITDIRMPGISGLELIERISKAGLSIQFIILSGYGEFEYAKTAMKYGVKHYLLKPCDDEQLSECLRDTVNECEHRKLDENANQKEGAPDQQKMQYTLIYNLIREGISAPVLDEQLFSLYENYISLTDTSYQLCYIYYLESKNLEACIHQIDDYFKKAAPKLIYYCTYVSNTLILFFPGFEGDYQDLDRCFRALTFPDETVGIVYERHPYQDLQTLLTDLIPKLKRYDILSFQEDGVMNKFYNYGASINALNQVLMYLQDDEKPIRARLDALGKVLGSVTDQKFLLQLIDYLLISLNIKLSTNTMVDITDFLCRVHKMDGTEKICQTALETVSGLLQYTGADQPYSAFIEKLLQYIENNYSDPNLTLKLICNNELFMNVNYVSRVFQKETGMKFSGYLSNLRVNKAKELLAADRTLRISDVAVMVGCGNNPYYFSKIFKKYTNMAPTVYIHTKL